MHQNTLMHNLRATRACEPRQPATCARMLPTLNPSWTRWGLGSAGYSCIALCTLPAVFMSYLLEQVPCRQCCLQLLGHAPAAPNITSRR